MVGRSVRRAGSAMDRRSYESTSWRAARRPRGSRTETSRTRLAPRRQRVGTLSLGGGLGDLVVAAHHRLATIDGDLAAGDERRLVGREPECGVGDVAREPRTVREDADGGRAGVLAVDDDPADDDGVAADAFAPVLRRDRSAERVHPALAGGVARMAGKALHRHAGRAVDDRTASGGDEVWDRVLGRPEHG